MKHFSFEGFKAGDVIVGRDGERAKILDVLPNTFIRSMWGEFNSFGCVYSYEYAIEAGWTFEEVEEEKWTKEQLDEHIKKNSDDTYSMAVPLAALYMKLYGVFPKIGLSGFQAENADRIAEVLPEPVEIRKILNG